MSVIDANSMTAVATVKVGMIPHFPMVVGDRVTATNGITLLTISAAASVRSSRSVVSLDFTHLAPPARRGLFYFADS